MDLKTIWFVLVGVLIIGYAILDGFDLGVGVLHLFARTDHERRVHLNAIGPVWDGNEVWLLTGGGALFAAFPVVYATVFSGFYIALMLLLVALIFRAVSMEFRGKVESPRWRRFWDWAFGIGSLLAGHPVRRRLRQHPARRPYRRATDVDRIVSGTAESLRNSRRAAESLPLHHARGALSFDEDGRGSACPCGGVDSRELDGYHGALCRGNDCHDVRLSVSL